MTFMIIMILKDCDHLIFFKRQDKDVSWTRGDSHMMMMMMMMVSYTKKILLRILSKHKFKKRDRKCRQKWLPKMNINQFEFTITNGHVNILERSLFCLKVFFSFVIIIITYFEAEPIKLLVKQSKIEPKYNHYK